MKKYSRVWILVSGLLISLPLLAASPPPISAFARVPAVMGVDISPDGRYLAMVSSAQGKRGAVTIDLQNGSASKVVMTSDNNEQFEMQWCHWANNTRLLCGFRGTVRESNFVHSVTRMAAVNADGTNLKQLLKSAAYNSSQFQDEVLDWAPKDPNTVLIQTVDNADAASTINSGGQVFGRTEIYPAVFSLNVNDGTMIRQTRARAPILNFLSDLKGNVRLGYGYSEKSMVYFARLDGESEWHQLGRVKLTAPTDKLIPVAMVPGTNKAYALGPNEGRKALWLIDIEDKTPPELIFSHPLVDVDGPIRDINGRLLGVNYVTDRPFSFYVDDNVNAFIANLKKVLPGNALSIKSHTKDWSKLIILAERDADNGTYYLFDVASSKLQRISTSYPELPVNLMARMRTIEYKATDGATVPGYLTVPVGAREEKLPLIVMPHGGPIARDYWNFDFLQQFLVSRGYAVLQMNFRGSSGYGNNWQWSAHRDWGGLTYSDILDGARWTVSQGIADPQRLCIIGWNFGGYSALIGAERNGDVFKCSISIAGVSDLIELQDTLKNYVVGEAMADEVGIDKGKLKVDSPVLHAKDTKSAVLIIHGDMDAEVPYQQSKEMADALKKAGKNYKFVSIKNADHSLWRESERVTLLTEIEQFLQAYLGAGITAHE